MAQSETIVMLCFLALVVLILMIDIGVFSKKKEKEISFKEALGWTSVWVSLALITWLLIYLYGERIHGIQTMDDLKEIVAKYSPPITIIENDLPKSLAVYRQNLGLEFITGYLVEYSLSIDNIFVIVMIFYSFGVDKIHYHRILFWGILGAIAMRFLFIFISAALIEKFDWILIFFGALLIFTGIKMFLERNKEKDIDTKNHPVIRFASRIFSVDYEYTGSNFFIRKNGKLFISTLFVVLLVIEFSDLIFAVDSVPAIFSITKDPFIVYFSNIFAIIGLRSLFFLLINVLEKFRYLHIGLSVLLVFVGVKMIIPFIFEVHVTTMQSLTAIILILAFSMIASVLLPARKQ